MEADLLDTNIRKLMRALPSRDIVAVPASRRNIRYCDIHTQNNFTVVIVGDYNGKVHIGVTKRSCKDRPNAEIAFQIAAVRAWRAYRRSITTNDTTNKEK
jgi:hypothetical protein